MKTISYNTEKEIRIGITIIVFIMAIFAAIRIRELQLNDMNFAETLRADRKEISYTNFQSLPVADAKLIDEPLQPAESLVTTNASLVNEHELALKLKTWVNKGGYWSDETAENENELAQQMTTWMKNGTFFNSEKAEEFPATKYEKQSDRTNSENIDSATPEKELVSQLKSWINKGEYWSVANN